MRDIFRPNTTHHAKVARRKENSVGRDRTRDKVMLRTPKGWTPRWRKLMRQEGNEETRNRDFEDQLLLGSKWKFNKTLRRGNGLEIAKEINTSPVLLQRRKHWNLWRGRPLPKQKKETARMGGNGRRSTGLLSKNE
jgi:hypothetical protein